MNNNQTDTLQPTINEVNIFAQDTHAIIKIDSVAKPKRIKPLAQKPVTAVVDTVKVTDSIIQQPAISLDNGTSRFENDTLFFQKEQKSIYQSKPTQQRNTVIVEYGSPITLLKTKDNSTANPISVKNHPWIFSLGLILFLLLVVIKIFFEKYFRNIFQATVDNHFSNKLFSGKNVLFTRTLWFTSILFYFSIGLLVWESLLYMGISIGNLSPFLVVLGISSVIFLLYIFKLISSKILGYIFLQKEIFDEYLFIIIIMNISLGLVLLPIVMTAPFVAFGTFKMLIFTGLILTAIFYLFHIFRAYQIIIRKKFSFFYLILYLCVFEILPIAYVVYFMKRM